MTNPAGAAAKSLTDRCFIRIDVTKAWLDVAVRPAGPPAPSGIRGTGREQWRVENRDAALPGLVEQLQALMPQVIVLEASRGSEGYERLVVARLAEAGPPVTVVNPRQVRDFAKAIGRLAKTDHLDAEMAQALARFAEAVHPEPRPLPDAASQHLVALLERRTQLVGILTAEKNRRAQAVQCIRPHIAAHIAWLEQALENLDQWREREYLLRSVPVWVGSSCSSCRPICPNSARSPSNRWRP